MDKIASPAHLQSELRALLAYCEQPNPSRAVVAAKLQGLAGRVVVAMAGQPIESEIRKAYDAGLKSKGVDLDEAKREVAHAASEATQAIKQIAEYPPSALGAPIGAFANIAAALWELGYYKGIEWETGYKGRR